MPDFEVGFHPRASRQAKKLPTDVDNRIQSKLTEMVNSEWRELWDYDVEPVKGTEYDIYRTRIGGYRVFFAVGDTRCAILHIDKREGAYGNVKRLVDRFKELFD